LVPTGHASTAAYDMDAAAMSFYLHGWGIHTKKARHRHQ
jgi:hypothetical protein